jgi:hypothetical protein
VVKYVSTPALMYLKWLSRSKSAVRSNLPPLSRRYISNWFDCVPSNSSSSGIVAGPENCDTPTTTESMFVLA